MSKQSFSLHPSRRNGHCSKLGVQSFSASASMAGYHRGCAYRVPYLPVIPTFFVRFVIVAVVCG